MSNPLTDGCVACPKCKQKRFDPICGSCERRQCGYVEPKDTSVLFADVPPRRLGAENPMTRVNGVTAGEECGGCVFFRRDGMRGKYHKCERRGMTHGAGTDHHVHWTACGLFTASANRSGERAEQ